MRHRRSTMANLGATFACWGLMLALGAPAEAGGRGGHRGHGYRSHSGGHSSVGYYRGSGRTYRPVVHRSTHHRHGVYGTRGRSYRAYPYYPGHRTYPYYPVYPSYRPSPSIEQGYRNHLPYPVTLPQPAYGGTVYVDAQPVYAVPYAEAPAPTQPQTIYIVLQPPAAPAAPAADAVATASAPTVAEPAPTAASPSEPGKVHLRVEPADATVYLDDEPLGSGAGIARLGEPLSLSSGVHVIEVSHPDYPPQRLVFGVPSAGELRVEIDLDGDHRGRKAEVKDLDHGPVDP